MKRPDIEKIEKTNVLETHRLKVIQKPLGVVKVVDDLIAYIKELEAENKQLKQALEKSTNGHRGI